jgi:hypothetical protein
MLSLIKPSLATAEAPLKLLEASFILVYNLAKLYLIHWKPG